MTPAQSALLHAVASCMFYQPNGNEAECEELASMGYVRPINQGKLAGYSVALAGMIYLRKRGGYE